MEDDTRTPLPAIDQIANGSHLMALKALLPYLPWSGQRLFACYIKMQEMTNLMNFYRSSPPLQTCSVSSGKTKPTDMLQDIRNYCSLEDQDSIDQFLCLFRMLELYQTLQGTENNTDALKNLLSPEQQALFETYQSMLHNS